MTEFTVRQGMRYRANVKLSWLEQVASNEQIAQRLAAVGFADVTVTGQGRQRVAEATWRKSAITAQLDPHLSDLVELTA